MGNRLCRVAQAYSVSKEEFDTKVLVNAVNQQPARVVEIGKRNGFEVFDSEQALLDAHPEVANSEYTYNELDDEYTSYVYDDNSRIVSVARDEQGQAAIIVANLYACMIKQMCRDDDQTGVMRALMEIAELGSQPSTTATQRLRRRTRSGR